MADKIAFTLVSPSENLYSADADMVIIPTASGDMGVMAGHSQVMATLRPGVIIIRDDGNETRLFVAGGFMEVNDKSAIVLAENGIDVSQIDLTEAKNEFEKAEDNNSRLVAQAKISAVESKYYQ